jgi:uncharacterized lipoprotein YajG
MLDQEGFNNRGLMRKILPVVLTLSLLAGCSRAARTATVRSTAPLAPLAASSGPTATPSPLVHTWTAAEAQGHYLADVATFNADLMAYQQLTAASPVSATTTACGKLAADQDAFAKALSTGLWPANAQTQVAALVTAVTQSRGGFLSCAAATTQAAAAVDIQAAGVFAAPARAMRLALGLPTS